MEDSHLRVVDDIEEALGERPPAPQEPIHHRLARPARLCRVDYRVVRVVGIGAAREFGN